MEIYPASLCTTPKMTLSVVLFPAPFSPISPTIVPRGTSNDISDKENSLYFLVNPDTVFVNRLQRKVTTRSQKLYKNLEQ